MKQAIERLQDSLVGLINKAGPVVSAAIIADSFLEGSAVAVLAMQKFGFAPSDLLRVPAVNTLDDPDGATMAIRAHRGPVVVELARAMPTKIMNQLLDNEMLARDKRTVLLVFEAEDWIGNDDFFRILAKVGYAVIHNATIQWLN